jgi:hypothetical protein
MNCEFITNITGGCGGGIVTTSRVAEAGQASVEEPCETRHTLKGTGASLGMKHTLPREVSPDKNSLSSRLEVGCMVNPIPQNAVVTETVQIV